MPNLHTANPEVVKEHLLLELDHLDDITIGHEEGVDDFVVYFEGGPIASIPRGDLKFRKLWYYPDVEQHIEDQKEGYLTKAEIIYEELKHLGDIAVLKDSNNKEFIIHLRGENLMATVHIPFQDYGRRAKWYYPAFENKVKYL